MRAAIRGYRGTRLRARARATYGHCSFSFYAVSCTMHRLRHAATALQPSQEAALTASPTPVGASPTDLATVSELPPPGEDWAVPPVPMTEEQKFFFVRTNSL